MAKILSRHGTRDLPCKFPEQIHYSESPKQQRKEGMKHVNRCENKEWQKTQSQGTGGLQMYIYRNQQTVGQKQENIDKTD